MRQVRFLPVILLTFLLSSCNDTFLIKDVGSKEQGALSLNLSMDSGLVMSKAEDPGSGSMTAQDTLDNFRVEIYRKVSDGMTDGVRLYKSLYAEAKQSLIPLDAGEYYMRAKFGDSLGIGFDRPFLMAEKEFTVRPQTRENVTAVAKISNVKVSVKFGDYFQEYYPDYYVKVINNDPKLIGYRNSVTFEKEETRSAFIHHGHMTVEVYADFKGDGNWSYYQISGIDADNDGVISDSERFRYSPNDHVTFDIDAAEKLYGDLLVNIKIENGTEDKTFTSVIPEYKAPQDGPVASRQGFDVEVEGQAGYAYVYENRVREYNEGQSFSYSAKAGMASCALTVNSAALGFNARTFNLADASDVEILRNAGIRCSLGQFMGIVDFTDAMKSLGMSAEYVSDTAPCAEFSMTVTDEAGEAASVAGSLLVWPELKGTMTIPDYDVWAWKVVAPTVEITKGKPEYCQLQMSEDGKEWVTIQTSGTVSGNRVVFADVAGLDPSTEYWFRAVDGEFAVTEGAVKVATEAALQLGNPSFEDWRTIAYSYYQDKVLWTGGKWATRDWYEPYKEGGERWWSVNSKKTMPSNVTGNTATGLGGDTQPFKVFPTVSYSIKNKYSGSYSAQLMTIGVGYSASSSGLGTGSKSVVPGELFIGTADDSGNPVSYGHAFASRPGKISFKYQYLPSGKMADDKFYMLVEVRSGDTPIVRKVVEDGPKADAWTEYVLDLGEYSVKNMKATSLTVSFRSSKNTFSANTSYLDENVSVEVAGSNYNVHRGSVLRIDDLKVLYE